MTTAALCISAFLAVQLGAIQHRLGNQAHANLCFAASAALVVTGFVTVVADMLRGSA